MWKAVHEAHRQDIVGEREGSLRPTLATLQDKNTNVNYEVTCKVVKLVARHKHLPGADSTSFKCPGE